MKYNFTIAACSALFLALATSCGDSSVDAQGPMDQVKAPAENLDLEGFSPDKLDLEGLAPKSLNLDSLTPDAMKAKAEEILGNVTSSLGDIKDLASAEQVKEKLTPLLDKFGDLKGLLGDNLPDLSSLSTAVGTLKSKFDGNTEVMDALKPLLEKLTSFLK